MTIKPLSSPTTTSLTTQIPTASTSSSIAATVTVSDGGTVVAGLGVAVLGVGTGGFFIRIWEALIIFLARMVKTHVFP
jgi:hypothetical protein